MSHAGLSFPRLRARTRGFTLGEPRSVTVAADGRRLLFLRAAAGDDPATGLWRLDLPEGVEQPVIPARPDAELTAAERARRERARETAVGVTSYAADQATKLVAAALSGQLCVVEVDSGLLRTVPDSDGCFDPRPDPTGQRIGYVSGGELRVVAADGSGALTLGADPDPGVFWGRAEFVAAEEMDRFRGFWWAPGGDALLATRVDESSVPRWWITDPAHPDRVPKDVRYPAAGTADARVTLWWLAADGSERREVRWDSARFPYVGRVTWTAAGPPLIQVMASDQRTVQVLGVDVRDGETNVLHTDTDPAWVEFFDGVPAWWADQVVRIADRDGVRGLMHGETRVSSPEMYVRAVAGVTDDAVVFTASEGDPTAVSVYRYDGVAISRVSDAGGVHSAAVGGRTVVITAARLDADGTRMTVTGAPGAPVVVRSRAVPPPLTPQVRMLRLGPRELRAGLVLPREHERGQQLPVVMDPYGGPGVQRVLAARRLWLEPQWLADQGFAVLVVDGRGMAGRDPAWERAIHLDFAGPVLADQVDALHAAADLEPDLDLTRVGIKGWSFGGYLAALAVLRRPDVFAVAVAGAPVTDWSLYDTFYTHRYLGTPQDQPDAYDASSLIADAPTLTRPLLLVHGLADDNVVAAHTLRLSQRLTEAGRPHTVLPLTGVTHMTRQEEVAENLLIVQVEFLARHLGIAPQR